uniref:Rab-GAP TBC domain-containing protein n=1 Tax=Kwoniella dejecticola CBS 10117 TaxID=1296121 RepID=A0A1A5ZTW1_9TREE|nr:uncharacterized protein I303_08600 [Kwoniella dejecticola CBS 10117]OBR81215.1 hypothetical protein I303_08600 [Kwoniella dejecticola CBS 10117]
MEEKRPISVELDNVKDWVVIRESWTKKAIEAGDHEALRKISALPGGFGGNEVRKKAWSTLLRTQRLAVSEAKPAEIAPDADIDKTEYTSSDVGDGCGLASNEAGPSELKAHPNERQVKLDTDRSFVTYPKGIPSQHKLELQNDLNDLIVGVLRRSPALSYFQGYHDILSVLYLTFIPLRTTPPRSRSSSRTRIRKDRRNQHTPEPLSTTAENDEQRPTEYDTADEKLPHDRDTLEWRELRRCAEMISLNRVRDAMGSGMEGMMGLLRILKRILKAADPELSRFSAKISPVPTLPFFALSWVLTLFSHDCDDLVPLQRMFDFLLARNPISAVYLAASILILKKPQMLEIAHQLGSEYEEDPTLLHPLFVRLPPLYPDTPSEPDPPPITTLSPPNIEDLQDDSINPYRPIRLSELFELTDTLMVKHPWDGDVIKGKEIMGEGSVVHTYAQEANEDWTSQKMLDMIDVEVVRPGAGQVSEDEEEEEEEIVKEKRRVRIRRPRSKVNIMVAVGVIVLGIGIAKYGFKAGGNEACWGKWWGVVLRGWANKEGVVANVTYQVRKVLQDVL